MLRRISQQTDLEDAPQAPTLQQGNHGNETPAVSPPSLSYGVGVVSPVPSYVTGHGGYRLSAMSPSSGQMLPQQRPLQQQNMPPSVGTALRPMHFGEEDLQSVAPPPPQHPPPRNAEGLVSFVTAPTVPPSGNYAR